MARAPCTPRPWRGCLKIRRVIVPFGAGVTSALGFLVAPAAVDDVRSYVARLESLDWDTVNGLYAGDGSGGGGATARSRGRCRCHHARAPRRDASRGSGIRDPGPGSGRQRSGAHSLEALREAFFDTYLAMFERTVRDVPIEAMSWRLSASASPRSVSLDFADAQGEGGSPVTGERSVHFPGEGTLTTRVYDRRTLRPGLSIRWARGGGGA